MEGTLISRKTRRSPARVAAADVIRLRDKIVNSYLVVSESGSWVIVDAGMSAGHAKRIRDAAEEHFGTGTSPEAILLTHGHFDHTGALEALLQQWNVPVYAHELEMPYLTGHSEYPPPDPTVGGGLMTRMSPLFPLKMKDFSTHMQVLPEDGSVPHLSGWRWIHTPGHTPGHVSFFRDSDRLLIAGDAFVTVKNESICSVLRQKQAVNRPPAYFTTNWEQARRSVEILAELNPAIAATGHGIPMSGYTLRNELETLAHEFNARMPKDGRYVRQPAISDATGVHYIPPPAPDPWPKVIGAIAALGLAAVVVGKIRHKRKRRFRHA